MAMLDLKKLNTLRQQSYHTSPGSRVRNMQDALAFIKERGFAFFWPVKGVELPSLWAAVAGNRPVADEHDDPGHVTWGWKDESLDKKIWYYGKILRRKATFISLEVVPYFYALSDNYGSPEEDYLVAYDEGRLTQAAKQVYETLLEQGTLDTLSLRKEARLQNEKESAFNRALEDLQRDFKILPMGISEAGAWKYAYRYDITARYFPELQEQARGIGEGEARRKLVELLFHSVGAATRREVSRLFGWTPELTGRAIDALIRSGALVGDVEHPQDKGEWLALPGLVR